MSCDSLCLDTENRKPDSTLSVPIFKINRFAFMKNDKIKISIAVPPMYNIDNTNNNITIDNTIYTIPNGFYESIDDVISAFNNSISSTGISISINNLTGFITILGGSNFVLSKTLLFGFTENQFGNYTYIATQGIQLNKNTICISSNLSGLFPQLNLNKQQENNLPKNYLFSFLNSSVNAYNYITSEWMTVGTSIMYDELLFFFGITGNPPAILTDIKFNWSVIIDVQRNF
jgi:hypothetical protein